MLRIRDRHTGVVQSVHPPPGSPATRTRDVIEPRRRAVARRMFADRKDAGSQLAQRIAHRSFDRPVVYALARGGLPVAAEVAGRLGAPLDVILVRKLGAPGQPELAIGAVADGHDATVVLHENIVQQLGISPTGITAATDRAFAEIERQRHTFLAGSAPIPATDCTAIVVDDGVATGATAEAALQALRKQHPKRLILAIPVAPLDTATALADLADEVICLQFPDPFLAVGYHYASFAQVTDAEVRRILSRARATPYPSGVTNSRR